MYYCAKLAFGVAAFGAGVLLSLILPAGWVLFITALLVVAAGVCKYRDCR
ncbi:MAG: hypothetical protein IJC25_02405 [Clostridia bacterium]|nr:hypothetical protein [Clostridia bacterium]